MSVIRVDNFGPSAGGTTYSASNVAKAWVTFNGTGTVAILEGNNVSSITDNGTGDYTVNFTNVFANANYAVVSTSGSNSTTANAGLSVNDYNRTKTASLVPVVIRRRDTNANIDMPYLPVALLGDLA